jgi:O-antigen ligase
MTVRARTMANLVVPVPQPIGSYATITDRRMIAALLASVGWYATQLGFSPIYLVYTLVIPFLIFAVVRRHARLRLDFVVTVLLCLFCLGHFVANVVQHDEQPLNGSVANLMLGAGAYAILRCYSGRLTRHQYATLAGVMVWSTALVLAAATIYRLISPEELDPEQLRVYSEIDAEFYQYKLGDPLFLDTNTTALVALSMVGFLHQLWVRGTTIYEQRKALFVLLAVICLSYSRASWLATAVSLAIYLWFHQRNVTLKYLGVLVATAALLLLAQKAVSVLDHDSSFQFKLSELDRITTYFINSDIMTILLGIGPGKAVETVGVFTHNLFLTYLLELGLVGLLLFIWFISLTVRRAGLMLVPSLIAGISYYLYLGAPFLFVPVALLMNSVGAREAVQWADASRISADPARNAIN